MTGSGKMKYSRTSLFCFYDGSLPVNVFFCGMKDMGGSCASVDERSADRVLVGRTGGKR